MSKTCGIYKITSPSGKKYIGQSVWIERRFKKYKRMDCKGQIKLYCSFVSYGIEKHTFEIIEKCDKENLNELEIYYVNLYKSFDSEYGLNLRAGGNSGADISFETREKLRKAGMGNKRTFGRKQSKEEIQKRIDTRTKNGTWGHSIETIQKIRLKKLGTPNKRKGKVFLEKSKYLIYVPYIKENKGLQTQRSMAKHLGIKPKIVCIIIKKWNL